MKSGGDFNGRLDSGQIPRRYRLFADPDQGQDVGEVVTAGAGRRDVDGGEALAGGGRFHLDPDAAGLTRWDALAGAGVAGDDEVPGVGAGQHRRRRGGRKVGVVEPEVLEDRARAPHLDRLEVEE